MPSTATPAKGAAPTHIAYQVKEHSKQGYWHRIGAAWTSKDGKGVSLQLDSLPLDGRIILRLASDEA